MGICGRGHPRTGGRRASDHDEAAALVGEAIAKHLGELMGMPQEQMLEERYKKFREMAKFFSELFQG